LTLCGQRGRFRGSTQEHAMKGMWCASCVAAVLAVAVPGIPAALTKPASCRRRTGPTSVASQERLSMELHPWYGSAALMMVNEVHSKIEKPVAVAK
jgi:hypothetical protein